MKQFKKSISNKNFERLLANPENIPLIDTLKKKETLANWRFSYLKCDGKIDFGPSVDKKELSDMLGEVKSEVDNFLGTEHISKPSIEFNRLFSRKNKYAILFSTALVLFSVKNPLGIPAALFFLNSTRKMLKDIDSNIYSPAFEIISLNSKWLRTSLIPSIAHEYAHHVIYKQGFVSSKSDKERSFNEGFARGIERYIANLYREKEDNPSFLVDHTQRIGLELFNAALWISLQNGTLLDYLNAKKISSENIDSLSDEIRKHTNNYDIGTPLIYIHELKNGPGIYKEMAHGRYKFE